MLLHHHPCLSVGNITPLQMGTEGGYVRGGGGGADGSTDKEGEDIYYNEAN